MLIIAIYDKLSKEFGPITEAKNGNTAVRMYQNFMAKQDNVNVEEFSLYRLGEINKETGIIIPDKREIILSLEEEEDE